MLLPFHSGVIMTPNANLPSLAEIHDLDSSTQTITLKDQRKLSFNIFGAEGGKPVFYFHGGPSSRLEGSMAHQTAIQRNYRIICLDRPGHGLSDPKPGYKIVDLADDVLELAAHLDLDRFGVMGTSGGGPPVIACAYRIQDRLDFAAAFGSAAPIYTDPTASKELSAFDRITANLSVKLPIILSNFPFPGLTPIIVPSISSEFFTLRTCGLLPV